jgi:hypothetical protein
VSRASIERPVVTAFEDRGGQTNGGGLESCHPGTRFGNGYRRGDVRGRTALSRDSGRFRDWHVRDVPRFDEHDGAPDAKGHADDEKTPFEPAKQRLIFRHHGLPGRGAM